VGPYLSLFATQFQLTLQYRTAAVAGFVTQCWWGGLKIAVLSAFFATSRATDAPIGLTQLVSYVWLAQGLLALQPWNGDPAVAAAVRTGGVALERLRPLDTYWWWYARSASTLISRALPRAALMVAFAGVALPLAGLGPWGLSPPAGLGAGLAFLVSLVLVVALAATVVMLINVLIVTTMTARGANTMVAPFVILLSGSEIPLPLLPDVLHAFLFVQPLAGVMDIPFRIYVGDLTGPMAAAGVGLQVFWTVVLALVGRRLLARAMQRLEVQGG